MINSSLSGVVVFAHFVNMALALVSGVANWWGAVKGARELKNLRVAQTTLSFIYVICFAWILFTDVDRADWAEYMAGLAPLAFVLMWIMPAFKSTVMWKQLLRNIEDGATISETNEGEIT